MDRRRAKQRTGFTLIELLLVISLMAVLSAFLMPNFLRELESKRLMTSAENLRSLVFLTRTKAMSDGVSYRIRFADSGNYEGTGAAADLVRHQPVVEKEPNWYSAGEFQPVAAAWARDPVFLKGIRCEGVRLGKPVYEEGLDDQFGEEDEGEDPDATDSLYPVMVFEPDGTCEWATFVVTSAAEDVSSEDTEEFDSFDIIVDGRTGQAWLQRTLLQEEKDLLHEFGMPPVLRMDFLAQKTLTEDNIRLIQESRI